MTPVASGVLLMAAIVLPFGGKAHRSTEEGNQLYADAAYEDALRAYTEAQVAAPEAPELHYNIGNVLYRQGNPGGASEAFSRALGSAPPSLLSHAAYNLGNALYEGEKFEEAAEAYRRALRADPPDKDAKRNLELALLALQEQKESKRKQQQPEKQPQQQGEDKDEKQKDAEDPSKGDKKSPDEKTKPEKDSAKETPASSGEDRSKKGVRPGQMTPEEAKQLLDRLTQQEGDILKRRAQQVKRAEEEGREKDW